ncbi:MAG: hypothetical protein ABJF10_19845 [Chthoniobacter sp.]|uniref:hypothetical protein n=1 Tax=Chthoniobacter sp. TaxID=2510640 RepID=UPI0032A54FFD
MFLFRTLTVGNESGGYVLDQEYPAASFRPRIQHSQQPSKKGASLKSFILKWIAIMAILVPCGALAATPARGLVIYSDIPITYAETLEFVTITNTNAIIATAILPNGKRQEIARGGIIAAINYPPDTQMESLPQEAATALGTIRTLRPKYPQFSAKLDAIQTRWSNSLDVYRQRQRSANATPAKSVPTLTLEVDGSKYSQVELTSFDGATVGIAHAAGVAGIPATKLKPEQIVALNATSLAIRIDPTKIVAATPRPVTRSASPPSSFPTPGKATSGVPFTAVPGVPLTPAQKAANNAVIAREAKAAAAESTRNIEVAKERIQSAVSDEEVPWPRGLGFQNWDPNYKETLEFINGKIKAAGQRMWFGKLTDRMILQSPDHVETFDPHTFSTRVKMIADSENGDFVQAECADGQSDVFTVWVGGQSGSSPGIRLHCSDQLDVKRVATAMAHLIQMFGGKAEAF